MIQLLCLSVQVPFIEKKKKTRFQDDSPYYQWIGLGENLQESPIFNGKNHGFL